MKLCECGCGEPAPIARRTFTHLGHKKGEPIRFIRGHQMRMLVRRGADNKAWKGGRRPTEKYMTVLVHGHPRADRWGYVMEHLIVAERALGRPIPRGVEVHHVNEDGFDNKPSNLVICENAAYHRMLHMRKRAYEACGNPNAVRCTACGHYDGNVLRCPSGSAFHHGKGWRAKCRQRRLTGSL